MKIDYILPESEQKKVAELHRQIAEIYANSSQKIIVEIESDEEEQKLKELWKRGF